MSFCAQRLLLKSSLNFSSSRNLINLLRQFSYRSSSSSLGRRQSAYITQKTLSKRQIKSSLSLTSYAFGTLATAIVVVSWTAYTSQEPVQPPSFPLASQNTNQRSDMPTIKEGWPGNLTPVQEAKLKELWEAVFRVSGVIPPDKPSIDLDSPTDGSSEPGSAKKKRKKFGIFGRKDDETTSDPSHAHNGDVSAGEDKHGQTKEFHKALADQTPEELRETIWQFVKADDPDALLLRFLRARKWNVQNALVMMVSTTHWRAKDIHLDDQLTPRGEAHFADKAKNGKGAERKLGEDFMMQLRMGKSFLHGHDREGRPMCFVRCRLHKGGEQSEESLEAFTVHMIETCRMLLREPVDTAAVIFDMTSFSMANMDYTPVKFMIKVFEANYPESLGHVCVHRSPWLFHSIWNIIKGWLDPVVAAKVHFTKDLSELEAFVSPECIPKELGGKEEWEYAYAEPLEGENSRVVIGREGVVDAASKAEREKIQTERNGLVEEFEKETLRWCRAEGMQAETEAKRKELSKRLVSNYWRLDPFVRAPSLYDRTGVVGVGGKLNFYPTAKSGGIQQHSADDVD